jgi:hypothetical protein
MAPLGMHIRAAPFSRLLAVPEPDAAAMCDPISNAA